MPRFRPARLRRFCSACRCDRRQRKLEVSIPSRGGAGPLNLLIDSTGIKAEGEGEGNACNHGGPKRSIWRKIHIGIDEETLEVRAVEVTGSNIGDAPILPISWTRFRQATDRFSDSRWRLRHPQMPRGDRRSNGRRSHPAPQERQAVEARESGCGGTKPNLSRFEVSWPCALATVERISPPEPGRKQDELQQAAWPVTDGSRLRPPGRGAASPHRRAEWLHRARHTRHSGRRISPSGDRGTPLRT